MRRAIGLLGIQAVAALAVAAYAVGSPMKPDGGLQQIDLMGLREPVAGLSATGRPIFVLAPGVGGRCPDRLSAFLERRRNGSGLPSRFDVVLADAALARRLALPAATRGCHPGYVLVDPGGAVRYRTYDAGYALHTGEQVILLDALR